MCGKDIPERIRVSALETSRKLGDFLWFLSATPTCHKTNCVAKKTMLAWTGTFMITVLLWNSLLGWKIKNPLFCGYVITTFLWGRGELLSSKDHGGMIFMGGQRYTGGKSPLKSVVFNRLTLVQRCHANSSVLGQLSNFNCVRFALEATEFM